MEKRSGLYLVGINNTNTKQTPPQNQHLHDMYESRIRRRKFIALYCHHLLIMYLLLRGCSEMTSPPFWTFSDPYPPPCHQESPFDEPPL